MQILFEDHHLIAINKPAGLPTQAPAGLPALEEQVKAYIKEKYAKPAGVYLGIPQRLDRPVSGVIVFCRNSKAAARVAAQFHERSVRKTYWALVEGIIADERGEWRDLVRKVPDVPRAEIVAGPAVDTKEAVTEFRIIRQAADTTFLELTPHTGRMHQLRVQAAGRGHAILGDAVYGARSTFGPPADSPRERVIALHARTLVIRHPFRQVPVELTAPLPDYWPAGAA